MPKGIYVRKHVVSNETRQKMSTAHTGHKRGGWKIKDNAKSKIKGRKMSEEIKLKIGRAQEKHWNWKGGISKDVHSISEPKYKKWRSSVFERDNWTCQTCGLRGVYLEAHHIKGWAKYPEFRYIVENGVCLCKDCHKLTDNYRGKKN